jgi:uncharacterized phosphatase
MRKLYFVRHGQSEMNVSGHFAGITETPLTAEGREQAKRAGQIAKDFHIDAIVSSPLSRALETAQIIAKELGYSLDKIHINKLFIERDYGELEGKPWAPDLNLDGMSDIETVDTVLERAKLALDFLHTLDAGNILVVSHGTFGRALRSHILPDYPFHNTTTKDSSQFRIPNAEIVSWL